jgi:hypothetical protein
MAQPGVIADYRAVLLAELPASLAEEVGDGLDEAYEKYLRRGLRAEEAASTAVAEFGDARAVADAFNRVSPARQASRALIMTGPLVGACWAAELITARAWDWHVPVVAPLLLGALLAVTISVLATAALGHRYRRVRRLGIAGCAGLVALDVSMITMVLAAAPGVSWLAVLAICASAARLTAVARLAGTPG